MTVLNCIDCGCELTEVGLTNRTDDDLFYNCPDCGGDTFRVKEAV